MKKTNTPVLAGTLSIISAVMGFLGGLFFIGFMWIIASLIRSTGQADADSVIIVLQIIYLVLGAALLVAAILGVIGGVFAFNRRLWGWALAGAIASIVTFFPTGIPAVVFTAQSKSEFNQVPAEPGVEAGEGKTGSYMAGGIISLVSAGFGLLVAATMVVYSLFLFDAFSPMGGFSYAQPYDFTQFIHFFQGIYVAWAILILIAAVLSAIGGVSAMKGRDWGWALTGAIASILAFFPTGIAAIVLIAQSKDEFTLFPE